LRVCRPAGEARSAGDAPGLFQRRLIPRVTDPPTSGEIDRRTRAATDALLRLHAKTKN